MEKYKHAYIGIFLPESFIDDLSRVLIQLQEILPSVKIVSAKSSHITMYYLGRQTSDELEIIMDRLNGLNFSENFSEITLHGFDYFTQKHPRTIYIKPEPKNELIKLNAILVKRIGEFNFQEKPFTPHLTIARIRDPETQYRFENNLNEIANLLNTLNWRFPLVEMKLCATNYMDEKKFWTI